MKAKDLVVGMKVQVGGNRLYRSGFTAYVLDTEATWKEYRGSMSWGDGRFVKGHGRQVAITKVGNDYGRKRDLPDQWVPSVAALSQIQPYEEWEEQRKRQEEADRAANQRKKEHELGLARKKTELQNRINELLGIGNAFVQLSTSGGHLSYLDTDVFEQILDRADLLSHSEIRPHLARIEQ